MDEDNKIEDNSGLAEIVAALCSQVAPNHPNDFQRIYLISDPKEARLAYDVLIAHGFDAKIYHEDDHPSKLYVTVPTVDTSTKLAAALAYATALKTLHHDVDTIAGTLKSQASGYSMTFSNMSDGGKQILIQFSPISAPARAAAPAAAKTAFPAPAAKQPVPAPAAKKKYGAKPEKERSIADGPSLGKRYYPGKLDEKAKNQRNSLRRQIFLLISGNMATGMFGAISAASVLAIIFTIFIFLKGLLCPDFAKAEKIRNHAWYCEQSQEEQITHGQ